MEIEQSFLEKLNSYGVGRRKLDDILFINDKPPSRLGVYNYDDENLCHEVIKSTCNIPGCTFTAESLLEYENHYNACHRYACSQCKKNLPSPHLLDLHIQETHDSFFAVLAEKKPAYCCYIEECKEKFKNAHERLEHCVQEHKLPKDFRFESKPKSKNKRPNSNKKTESNKNTNTNKKPTTEEPMEMDNEKGTNKITLANNKQKTFNKYTGRKFTNTNNNTATSVNMDSVISDLKDSLPQ